MKNRTLPYGYCCVDGKITVHGGEAVIVAEIYKEYLDGKSLLAIAECLNGRQIEYMSGIIGWNKARLKRILEDERYIGNDQYPSLIDEEIHNAVLSVKKTRNTQKDTDRQADIYQLPVPVLCGECHGKMKRLYNRRRKCKTSWKCESCGKTVDKEDDELLADMSGIIGWNKARLKRILEDERYLGKIPYQRIISQEAYEAIQTVKNARNTQKETDRQSDIYQLTAPVICPVCQSKMKRIYASKRKCKTRWVCENRECRLSLDKEDGELLDDITELLNRLIANPHTIRMPTPQATEPSMELRILNNEIARMLDSTDIKREEVRAKMLQSLSQKYKEINPAPYIARKLITVLTEAEPLTAFNAELIGKTVNAVILHPNSTVGLILTNNQIIGKESDDGANYPSTESGQSDTADGQYRRNSCQ